MISKDGKYIPWKAIVARLDGTATAADAATLDEWLARGDNARRYERIEAVWNDVRKEGREFNADVEKNWEKLAQRMTKARRGGKPGMMRRLVRYAAVACVAVVVALGGAMLMYETPQSVTTYTNQNGKTGMVLPDGTKVWLHHNSSISYTGAYGSRERVVEMEGEAFFDVAHDKDVPFVVRSGDMAVTAHGTRFSVSTIKQKDAVYVGLAEGSVSVKVPGSKRKYMAPGQNLLFDTRTGALTSGSEDMALNTVWASDQLSFDRMTLGEICRYLSVWYDVEISVDAAIAGEYEYSFTLQDETLDQIMRIMTWVNPIDYRFTAKNKLEILPK